MSWPPGFRSERERGRTLIAEEAHLAALREAGFGSPEAWESRLAVGPPGGRGRSAVVAIGGVHLRLKRMRRGGLLAPLWRDRFVGLGRLRRNLELPLEARRRGVATPAPVAMLVVPGPPTLWRAWLAFEEIPRAVSLLEACTTATGVSLADLTLALSAVRHMHDRGIEHRDLNLGNVLLCGDGEQREAWIVDLDRARAHAGPLGPHLRGRALARLERSWDKAVRERGARPPTVSLAEVYGFTSGGSPTPLPPRRADRGPRSRAFDRDA